MSMRWRLLGSFLLIIIIALGTVAIVTRYRTEQEVESFLGYGGQIGLEKLSDSLKVYYAEEELPGGGWRLFFSRAPGGVKDHNLAAIHR